MSPTRREFVTSASAAAVFARLPALGRRPPAQAAGCSVNRGEPDLRTLAATALEAATRAGATYADVRLTLTREEEINFFDLGVDAWDVSDHTERCIGVRALVEGAWGFTGGPLWTIDAVARLGHEAAVQGKINAAGRRRNIDLGPPPPVVTGHWTTPIQRDPFTVSLPEKLDVGWALMEVPGRIDLGVASAAGGCAMRHRRQEKTFASTEGSFVSQTLYLTHPQYRVAVRRGERLVRRALDRLQPTAGGWEIVNDPTLVEDIPSIVDEASQMLDAELVTPDRYDVVFDALIMGQIVARTIGVAAELDRVLGYEANAGGTSYLTPPEEMLGHYALGPALLNVTANRSRPGGLATVRWDDEGVVPDEYALLKDGVLVDYHTTRELASALAPSYATAGRPVRSQRSHGCAGSASGMGITTLQPPNIEMHPGATPTTFDDLVGSLEKGLVICGGDVTVDRQQLNGEIDGARVYEVRNGKRTRFVRQSECLFRAPEFWKNLQAIGGAGTQRWTGMVRHGKGQPRQLLHFGVGAVPARVKGLAVTDIMRKA